MNVRFDTDAVIEALAALNKLTLTPESLEQVRLHLTIAAGHADTLFRVDLGDHEEPAPVFTP